MSSSSSTTSLPPVQPQYRDRALVLSPTQSANTIQGLFNQRPARVTFAPGVYFLNKGLDFPGCQIDGQGAKVIIDLNTPFAFGCRVNTGTRLRDLSISVASNVAPANGLCHNPLVAGCYFGAGREAHNWLVENCELSSTALRSSGIYVTGEAYGWRIQDVRIPDSPVMARGIAVHWGCREDPVVETQHPRGVVGNLEVGRLTLDDPETTPIFASAVRHLVVESCFCQEAHSCLVAYEGDKGYDLDPEKAGGVVYAKVLSVVKSKKDIYNGNSPTKLMKVYSYAKDS